MTTRLFSGGSIQRQLIVLVGGSVTVLLAVLGYIALGQIAELIEGRAYSEAQHQIDASAQRIEQFFVERARIPETVIHDPGVISVFERYDTYRGPIAGNRDLDRVIDYFDALVESDPTVLAVFFADADSEDYFSNRTDEIPSGRVEAEGYRITSRPWWREALEQDRLYVTSPQVDAMTGDVAVVTQSTVRLDDGRLLGVVGVDILINTVGDLVRSVRVQDEGSAFLVDGTGEIIYFAGVDSEIDARLADLDDPDSDTRGFTQLVDALMAGDGGIRTVRWRGERRLVFHAPIRSDRPQLDWSLGIMVPESLIRAPVRRNITLAIASIVAVILAVSALTLWGTRRVVTTRIRALGDRLQDIAEGRGDLTRRVDVVGTDEIAQLGSSFNTFTGAIQDDVRSIAVQADALAESSDSLLTFSQQIASASESTATQASMVSTAAEEVSANVASVATATEELNANTREIASNASEAARVATEATLALTSSAAVDTIDAWVAVDSDALAIC